MAKFTWELVAMRNKSKEVPITKFWLLRDEHGAAVAGVSDSKMQEELGTTGDDLRKTIGNLVIGIEDSMEWFN